MSPTMTTPVKLAGSPAEKDAVADAVYRFCLALDTRNPELFDTSFTEDATIELLGEKGTGIQGVRDLGKGLAPDSKFLLSGGIHRAQLVHDAASGLWKIKSLVIDLHWTDGDFSVFQDK
ncbi:hypothetical protein KL945_005407 [Ogataea haglerorum]|nr:hypothetical protein KL945_005407 [Ogataea haglerorum]